MSNGAPPGQAGRGPFDVAVLGGGVIGLAAAWRFALAGVTVAVVDPSPGHGASWVAAGMLAPVTEAHFGEEPLSELLLAGAAHWEYFAAELEAAADMRVGYRRCGTVVVGLDSSDRRAIDDVLAYQRSLGLDAVRLSASECRGLEPALSPGIRGGAHVPGDHQVDNRALLAALLEACRRAGVEFLARSARRILLDARGGASGAELDDESAVAAGMLVVAAGARSGSLLGHVGGSVPQVRPVKGHIVRLRGGPRAPLLSRTVRGLVQGRACYLVPRSDGSLVIGATSEERGFDGSVQVGQVFALLDDARRLVPGLDELAFEEAICGFRPATPDNAPYVGWTTTERLAVATGHYRNGILLAPITAAALVALYAGAAPPSPMGHFGAERGSHLALGARGALGEP